MSKAMIENVDDIVCTLQFTMSIADWKRVRKTLGSNAAYAEMRLMREIGDLIRELEQVLYGSSS